MPQKTKGKIRKEKEVVWICPLCYKEHNMEDIYCIHKKRGNRFNFKTCKIEFIETKAK